LPGKRCAKYFSRWSPSAARIEKGQLAPFPLEPARFISSSWSAEVITQLTARKLTAAPILPACTLRSQDHFTKSLQKSDLLVANFSSPNASIRAGQASISPQPMSSIAY
jgi:hypothetical protein